MEYKDEEKAVTRRDLAATEASLRKDLAATEASLKKDLAATEASLKKDIAATEASLKADIAIMEAKFEDRFKEVDEKIDHLPTKDEFFTAQDKLMAELKAIRQEQVMFLNGQDRHEKRIVRLEDHVGIGLPAGF